MSDLEDVEPFHEVRTSVRPSFWIREIAYLAILVLTVCGVAYVSMARQPIFHYWQFLAVLIALVCIGSGWQHVHTSQARWHVVWTQLLHWGAFLIAMNLVFLPSVQAIANADATSLIILLLLALGTFIAGVHLPSWRMCANGAVMALSVPAIAWLDQSALVLTLSFLVAVAIGGAILFHYVRAKGIVSSARQHL